MCRERKKERVYTEKANDADKRRLLEEVCVTAAEMAEHSNREDRQAEEALNRIWFRRNR